MTDVSPPALLPVLVVALLIGSVLWVFFDARDRTMSGQPVVFTAGQGQIASPATWGLGCLFAWVLICPLYLARRGQRPGAGRQPAPVEKVFVASGGHDAYARPHRRPVGVAMATRSTPFAPGTPCWVDLLSGDVAASQAFYGPLFGWTFTEPVAEFGGYMSVLSDGIAVGGMMGKAPEMEGPEAWTTYIATADIDATLKEVEAAAGQIVFGPHPVGDLGKMAGYIDPGGAMAGLWEAGTHTGFGKYNEPGSVTWDELHSKYFAASTAFYTSVFGWDYDEVADSAEFRYSVGKVGGEQIAGVLDAANNTDAPGSSWVVYFSVESADAAHEKALSLGATALHPPMDSPYGRMATYLDPNGAAFSTHQVLAAD